MSIHNVTIAGNLGGGLLASAATHVLTSSIFAAGPDTLPSIESTSPVTVLADHSLFELPCASCNLTFAGIGNLIGVSLGLLPLADNGGSTRTHSLSSTSPARDKGRNPLSFSTDQRGSGHPRIVGTRADIGAFESPDPPADCAGFTDVPGSSPSCTNVDWLRNRRITSGCESAAHYCPEWPVSRLAMAVFLQRLGSALGSHVHQSESGFLGPPGLPVWQPTLCSVPISPTAVSIDSRAHLDVVVSLLSSMTLDVKLQLTRSLDGGATWQPVHALPRNATLQAGQWESVRLSGDVDIAAPSAPLFNVELVPSTSSGLTLEGAYCRLRTRLQSRSDAALPIQP